MKVREKAGLRAQCQLCGIDSLGLNAWLINSTVSPWFADRPASRHLCISYSSHYQ